MNSKNIGRKKDARKWSMQKKYKSTYGNSSFHIEICNTVVLLFPQSLSLLFLLYFHGFFYLCWVSYRIHRSAIFILLAWKCVIFSMTTNAPREIKLTQEKDNGIFCKWVWITVKLSIIGGGGGGWWALRQQKGLLICSHENLSFLRNWRWIEMCQIYWTDAKCVW